MRTIKTSHFSNWETSLPVQLMLQFSAILMKKEEEGVDSLASFSCLNFISIGMNNA